MLNVHICVETKVTREEIEKIVSNFIIINNYHMRVAMVTDNPYEVVEYVSENKSAGLYFLDINIGIDMDGLSLTERIRECDPRGFIVFITVHGDTMHLAFKHKVEVMDFIVKDELFDFKERIELCIDSAHKMYTRATNELQPIFAFKVQDKLVATERNKIIYLENSTIDSRMIIIHLENGVFEFYGRLKEVEEKLGDDFFRCHKSYIVNLKKIKEVNLKEKLIYLENAKKCYVSVRKLAILKELLRSQRTMGYIAKDRPFDPVQTRQEPEVILHSRQEAPIIHTAKDSIKPVEHAKADKPELEVSEQESIEVVDPESVSQTPEKPERKKLFLLAGVFALSVAAVFLLQAFNSPGINNPSEPLLSEPEPNYLIEPAAYVGDIQETNYITINGETLHITLTELDLSGLNLTDEEIMPLRYMKYLTTLRLGDNQIRNITPLANLANLTTLNLRNNNINDIAPLANLANLMRLDLSDNPVSCWSYVMHIPNIWGMNYVTIRDMQFNIAATTELNLSSLNLTDEEIAPLRHMINLTVLWLGNNQITDLAPLSGLTQLSILNLSNNNIRNLTPLSGLTELKRLDVTGNSFDDEAPIMHVNAIWGLSYVTIRGERHSTALTELDLTNLDLTDVEIAPLRHMTNLTTLRLDNNRISDLAPISNLRALTTLTLSNNDIEDLTPLTHLRYLENLDLTDNPVACWLSVAQIANALGRPAPRPAAPRQAVEVASAYMPPIDTYNESGDSQQEIVWPVPLFRFVQPEQ